MCKLDMCSFLCPVYSSALLALLASLRSKELLPGWESSALSMCSPHEPERWQAVLILTSIVCVQARTYACRLRCEESRNI